MKLTLTLFLTVLLTNCFAQETLKTVSDRGHTTTPGTEIVIPSLNPNKYLYLGGTTGFARIGAFDTTFGSDNLILNKEGGNVGIGTDAPDQKLTIKGGGIGFDNNSVDKKLYSPLDGVLEWSTHDRAANHGFAVSHQGERRVYLNINGNSYLNGGNVGIGTTNPTDMLTVAGKIGAREIKVSTNAGADFVFEPDYKLTDLAALEKFVKTNKHLPEIPTAKEMVENGVNLGELNIKLLQKVEELTLHLIEKDKQMNTLQAVVDEQTKILKEIRKKIK